MINPKKFEIPSKATYKLEQMRLAAALLDHPEIGRRTILVAGTNGKGSTCTYLSALLSGTGLKVGTYSSPHVVSRTERIRINSKPISEFELQKFEKKYARVLDPLTYFERMTVLAFLIFREKNADVQVLEVGLGGRLDATNISNPDVSVISRIDYDHQEILGSSLSEIATEKAGIMRKRRPCFIAAQAGEVKKAFQKMSALKGASLRWASDVHFSQPIEKLLSKIFDERGKHQEENARLALSVFQELAFDWNLHLSCSEMKSALFAPTLPARLQVIRRKPLFLIDGAHNENAIFALKAWLKKNHSQKNHGTRKFHIVFGVMQDKAVETMIKHLKPMALDVELPEAFYPERQMSAENLSNAWGKVPTRVSKDIRTTLKNLWGSKNPTLVVGSFYLAGVVLKELKKMKLAHVQY